MRQEAGILKNDQDSDRIMCVGPTHPDMQSPGRVFDPGRGKGRMGVMVEVVRL